MKDEKVSYATTYQRARIYTPSRNDIDLHRRK